MAHHRLQIYSLPALKDNYVHVVVEPQTKKTLVIDPSESTVVENFLTEKNLKLDGILLTHHHHDHIGGVPDLLHKHPQLPVMCSDHDLPRIPGANRGLSSGARWSWLGHIITAILTPGHTLGAVSYHFPEDHLLFTGDTVFTWGCGRLFEGTALQLYESLQKIRTLPPETQVYCGHEYGQQNLAFCLWLSQQTAGQDLYSDGELMALKNEWQNLASKPDSRSVPRPLKNEFDLNPFFKARNAQGFQHLRRMKDDFRLEDYDALG